MFPGIQNRALIHSLWWSIEIKLCLNKWCTDKLYQKCPCSAHAEHCAGLMGGGGHTDWWKCNWSHVQCSSKQCWWQDYPGWDQQWLCNAMWPYQISSVLSTIHTALHIANYNQPVPARVLASQSTMGICLLKFISQIVYYYYTMTLKKVWNLFRNKFCSRLLDLIIYLNNPTRAVQQCQRYWIQMF